MMRLADIPSSIPRSPHRAAIRLDPYWDGLWNLGSAGTWLSRGHSDRLRAAGLIRNLPSRLRTNPADAIGRLPGNLDVKLDLLGAVNAWRTLTGEQQAAFSGRRVFDAQDQIIGDLFASDLIDAGTIWNPELETRLTDRAALYRPSNSDAFDRHVAPLLTFAEQVSVTGGEAWIAGGQFARHNILTAELCLRLAEFANVAAVLGERDARVRTLAYTGAGAAEPPGQSNKTADAVIVRPDGLRIAVESTATAAGTDFLRKARAWAQVLARRPLSDTGLVVLFVGIERLDQRNTETIRRKVRKEIAQATREVPGLAGNRTADRMFLMSWQEMFPARHEASADLFTLRCERPNGPGGTWAEAHLLDEGSVPFDTSAMRVDPLTVVHAAAGLRSTPFWLRRGVPDRPALHELPLRQQGLFPIPFVGQHRRTGKTQSLDVKDRAIAAQIRPPARLRY